MISSLEKTKIIFLRPSDPAFKVSLASLILFGHHPQQSNKTDGYLNLQVMVIPFVVGMFLAPETPHWYYAQGRDQEGLRSIELS